MSGGEARPRRPTSSIPAPGRGGPAAGSATPRARGADWVWWKHGVIYQVYPRSFQDGDGDGVGDLAGLIQRLDYFVELGVDALWLSPIYASPMADFGYDVKDHFSIDPVFGDMGDFRRLVVGLRRRGLRLILDYIPNHLSAEHFWFAESRSSPTIPRHDWFVWADPAPDGGPPNNWRSEFGGPAWSFEPARGQYYYHAFLPSQPDLNWRHPHVRGAMLNVLRFWMDRGVDGFRVDAIHHLLEDAGLRDNPANPLWRPGLDPADALIRTHTTDHPEVHEAIAAMREVVHGRGPGRVLIGEAYLPLERLVAYYGADGGGFDLPFNFHLMATPWTPTAIAALVAAYERQLPDHGWPNWVLGNHDRPRLASRVGPAQARVAAMLLLTLRGTPTLYQGDELGLVNTPIPADRVRDPLERNLPGLGLGRDPVRTPLPWSRAANAGFSTVEPWLPLGPDWRETCVEAQADDPGSLLSLHRALLALRRDEPALWGGDYAPVEAPGLLAYERRRGADRLLVVLDIAGAGGRIEVGQGVLLLSTAGRPPGETFAGGIEIAPDTGVVLRRIDG